MNWPVGSGMGAEHFLFGVQGRLNRAGYWIFWLIALYYLFLSATVLFGSAWQSLSSGLSAGPASVLSGLGGSHLVFLLLFLLPFLVACFCVTIRRLHDLDRSGAWSILYVLGPFALSYLALSLATDNPSARWYGQERWYTPALLLPFLLSFFSVGIQTWAFAELGCIRGTVGDNQYGPDPAVLSVALATPTASVRSDIDADSRNGRDLRSQPALVTPHCTKCGAEAGSHDRFCNRCGANLSASPT